MVNKVNLTTILKGNKMYYVIFLTQFALGKNGVLNTYVILIVSIPDFRFEILTEYRNDNTTYPSEYFEASSTDL